MIIPALDEEEAIGQVLEEIPDVVTTVTVADNGSTDRTPERARAAGAHVVTESVRGYGRACLAGLRAETNADVIVFLDADLSDYPEEMNLLLAPILAGNADFVLGYRRGRGAAAVGAPWDCPLRVPHQSDLANPVSRSRAVSSHHPFGARSPSDGRHDLGVDDRDAGQGGRGGSANGGGTGPPTPPNRTLQDLGHDPWDASRRFSNDRHDLVTVANAAPPEGFVPSSCRWVALPDGCSGAAAC